MFFILSSAKTHGIEEFLEADIIGHLNDEFFVYAPNGNDATNRIITVIINNLNHQISG